MTVALAQKLIKGERSIQQVGAEIIHAGCRSVFLVTGKHFQQVNELGFHAGVSYNHYIKSGTNVEEEEVEIAFREFSKTSDGAIVGIGGGSVLDIAKAIIYRCTGSSLRVPFFIAAPTTAGSGSEATHFAVLYKEKKKRSIAHPDLLPRIVILDPQLVYTLPAYQMAVSGMDAFSQAVESYWNLAATEESKQYARESISLWKEFFPGAVKGDRLAREKMLWSAHLAGKAINITKTTGSHALSYYLTANHGIPHGQAVALLLPVFFLYNKPAHELCSFLKVKDENEAEAFIQQIMKQAGLAVNFAELGLNKIKITDELLDDVNEERFSNNPVPFDRQQLKELIHNHL